MMKPCKAHLNQVTLFLNSFTIPSLLFLLLRVVLMKHSFDIVRLKKKRNCIRFTLISKLQAIAFKIKSKQMQKKKKKKTESCYCKHNILKELCM